jgi:DNA topoisomerase IB
LTKEEKEASKKLKEREIELHGYAIVDGYKERIGNFKIEPPGWLLSFLGYLLIYATFFLYIFKIIVIFLIVYYPLVLGFLNAISTLYFPIVSSGLFRGRGDHPKMGLVKRRVLAKDITINIGPGETPPQPPPGQQWKQVIHNDKVN